MDVRTEGGTYVWNFSPFYRTLSPVEAAAQKGILLSNWAQDLEIGTVILKVVHLDCNF